ncbi:MAG TPA: glutamate synthase subunit beta [Streptosporangiaceae bacterium]|nr:glutamate synthase subunit beta [Streptosporangiaceae bacterium]
MADPRGFMTTPRQVPARRPVDVRIQDWREVYLDFGHRELESQAGRCMDCGIPFCHQGCPLGNLIPEWNDLVRTGEWRAAAERLHATNNFPEFTGRLCPAPCESACVLGINSDPVTIKQVEVEIINRAWAEGWVPPRRPSPAAAAAGRRVAVIGSGPAGLAAAQQLTRAGHAVTVYERADAPGGLLRYGIPEFKMEKSHLDRRLVQMLAEGTEFRCGVAVGDQVTAAQLRRDFDAIVLACGATVPRGLPVPGAGLDGVHQAMDFLPLANRAVATHRAATANRDASQAGQVPAPRLAPPGPADLEVSEPAISARGRHVVIIGGGDTGADCLGTALRQGAASVTQLEILPRPPQARPATQPWPTYPMTYRVSSAHEEGGERVYAVSTQEFLGDEAGRVRALRLIEVELDGRDIAPLPGTERDLPCDLVLLAMGFTGAERGRLVTELGVDLSERGNVARDAHFATSAPGVFVAGDMGRGQSLIVWAIAEGRSAAAAADRYLAGETMLPAAIEPTTVSLR